MRNVLEDTLTKNIHLKQQVDLLGQEVERYKCASTAVSECSAEDSSVRDTFHSDTGQELERMDSIDLS